MSLKRILMVSLVAGGAPFWLLLRARLGVHFMLLLAAVWCLQLAGFWIVAGGYIPDVPKIWVYWCREMVVLYLVLSWVWVGQVVWWVIYEGESLLQRQGGSRPLFAGMFWLSSRPNAFQDLVVTFFATTLLAPTMNTVPRDLSDLTAFLLVASAVCFLVGAMICHANGNALPMAVKQRKPKQAKAKRYITRSHAQAKRSSEGLEQIFSRRDQALRHVTRT